MGFPLLDIVTVGAKLIDKLIPDPKAKAEAIQKLKELEQAGDLAQLNADLAAMTAQTDINKIEAASSNVWIAGWRPGLGWVGFAGLTMAYVVGPLVQWVLAIVAVCHGFPLVPPSVDMTVLMPLIMVLLGNAGLRTFEKYTGSEKNR
jgi:hypothetical protein